MAEILVYVPKANRDAAANLADFIRFCRDDLKVFGANLDWSSAEWKVPGVTFGNLDQKSRKLDAANMMTSPFVDFAKAYFRYVQGLRPNRNFIELRALKCLERALTESGVVGIAGANVRMFDNAADIARAAYSDGVAYRIGQNLADIATFVSQKRLVAGRIDWRNSIARPSDTVRTGKKAKELRAKKLPSDGALDALASIFASNPSVHRDVFSTSTSAMLLCAPSRISEVTALGLGCELTEDKIKGGNAYGWRFQPGKGAPPLIKWVPDSMVDVAKAAISRLRTITDEGRRLAKWLEERPGEFYRHSKCPDVPEDKPLSLQQMASALGVGGDNPLYWSKVFPNRFGLQRSDTHTLRTLNAWVHARQPKGFPWFDKGRGIRFSDALFCFRAKQLRTDMDASPVLLWKTSANILNSDLGISNAPTAGSKQTLFQRHGQRDADGSDIKLTTHSFRHLLNTMAQRGGLSQAEIARWSGRVDIKQNRVYDHMSEYELVEMLRSASPDLSLGKALAQIAERLASLTPMTRQEFNLLVMPTAHITEFGFCIHDFVVSPYQRFRDCLNCSEQICVKGDHRKESMRQRLVEVETLLGRAKQAMASGNWGADRWFEIHSLTRQRLHELLAILDDPTVPDGTMIRLRNAFEFSPARRALEAQRLLPSREIPCQLVGGTGG